MWGPGFRPKGRPVTERAPPSLSSGGWLCVCPLPCFVQWLKARGMLDKNATPPTRILPPEQEVTPQPSPVKTAKPAPADGAAGRGLAERRERVQKEEKGIPAQGRDAGPQPLKGLHFVLLGKLSQSQVTIHLNLTSQSAPNSDHDASPYASGLTPLHVKGSSFPLHRSGPMGCMRPRPIACQGL